MNVVLCEYAGKREFTAGNKARADAVEILKQCGYKHIPLYRSKACKPLILLQMITGCFRTFFLAGHNDTVFIQYPYYPAIVNKVLISILNFGKKIKKYKMCMLIHDIVGLRAEGNVEKNIEPETQLFENIDKVICHNNSMQKILKNSGRKKDYTVLGPFDYIYNKNNIQTNFQTKPSIIIAGNLSREKCGYIYKLGKITQCNFNLYGINYDGPSDSHIHYNGSFSPEELIEHLDGNYGLVWDGDSIDTCDGVFGRYLRYNNPHKFSLYIAAGIPLIVWGESALASYVEEKGIGISINSLCDLDDIIPLINEADYKKMVDNIMKIREQLIKGENLKRAIQGELNDML